MKSWTTTLTAAEAIAIGACDGRCLVASKDVCDCVCGGAYHGVLAGSAIGEVTHTVRGKSATPPRAARRHAASKYESRAESAIAAEFMIDRRVAGVTYREIAEELGVSRSTVGKRLHEFTTSGGAA